MPGRTTLRQHDTQRAYFDTADQPTMWPTESAYSRRHFRKLCEIGGLRPGSRILEVGAGMGRFTRMFDEAGFDIVASDISPGQVDALKRRFPHLDAFVANMGHPGAPSRRHDAVVGFFTLHHMPDLQEAFALAAETLVPGGRLAFCEPNAYYLPFYAQVLLTPRMSWSVEKGLLNMRAAVLEPALRAAQFEDIRFSRYGFLPPLLYNPRLGRVLDDGLDRLRLPTVARAFQIVTARRARA